MSGPGKDTWLVAAGRPEGEGEPLNVALSNVLDLMGQEIERLKLALETYRQSDHPDKDELVRWHVREIDERQDRLESLKQIYLAQRGADGPTH